MAARTANYFSADRSDGKSIILMQETGSRIVGSSAIAGTACDMEPFRTAIDWFDWFDWFDQSDVIS